MTTNFITTAEFREMNPTLDLSRYESDTTLSGVITRATAKVEDYLGYTLSYEAGINEKVMGLVNTNNDISVFPSKYPVRSVTSASIVKGSFNATINLTTSNYDMPSAKDEIVFSGSSISLDTVTLLDLEGLRLSDFYLDFTYSAGYYMYDRPQILIDAVNLYAKDEISRSLNQSGASELRQGAVTIKYSSSKGESDFIQDAKGLLSSLKRVV